MAAWFTSQRVLLALIQKGLSREASYSAVQRNAMKVWRGEGDFLGFLKADPEVTLSDDELAKLFDLGLPLQVRGRDFRTGVRRRHLDTPS